MYFRWLTMDSSMSKHKNWSEQGQDNTLQFVYDILKRESWRRRHKIFYFLRKSDKILNNHEEILNAHENQLYIHFSTLPLQILWIYNFIGNCCHSSWSSFDAANGVTFFWICQICSFLSFSAVQWRMCRFLIL